MEKEKYLFLDFDGVLNTMEYQTALQWKGEQRKDQYGSLFDPYAVENLNLIIEHTAAKIVITSSWRLEELNRVCFNNLEGGDNSYSVIPYGTRGLEINEWLSTNTNYNAGYSYVIIDDFDDFISSQKPHVVLTEPETGLTKELAEKAIDIIY